MADRGKGFSTKSNREVSGRIFLTAKGHNRIFTLNLCYFEFPNYEYQTGKAGSLRKIIGYYG